MNILSNPSLYIEGQSGCFYSKKYYILVKLIIITNLTTMHTKKLQIYITNNLMIKGYANLFHIALKMEALMKMHTII